METDRDKNKCYTVLNFIALYWKGMFLIIWPFLSTAVFLLGTDPKFRCLFLICLMAGYWVTECIPLPVTGLIPLVALPVLAVQDTGKVCLNYMNATNVIFMASIFIASAIEYCGLHRRIAYGVIMAVGCSPRRLHFGLSIVTALLSMWLINSATTAMMCPIILAILGELEKEGIGSVYKPKKPTDPEDEPPKPTNITVAYFLSAAYCSTIGGMGCIVGTGTNLTYKGLYETRFPDGNNIDFVPWLLFNFPPTMMMAIFCWFSLELMFMGLFRPNSEEAKIIKEGAAHKAGAEQVMKEKMDELGSMHWNECGVLILFIICILLWFFRKPQFMTGWGDFYVTKIADASPAIAVVVFFVILPVSWVFCKYCAMARSERPTKLTASLVPWKVLQEKMPWGLLFLLGGGFALADAGKVSGMSMYLGNKMSGMGFLPPFAVLCATNFFASMVTELTSNTAICNILVPILMEMAVAMKVHPISFTYTAALMCSCSFLLPVGTPPNAIIVEKANIGTGTMVKGGILIKLFSWALYMCLFPTYGKLFFEMDDFPDWVLADNATE